MKQGKPNQQANREVMGNDVGDLYDLTVAGKPEDTVYDDMVQAFKPDLKPQGKDKGK